MGGTNFWGKSGTNFWGGAKEDDSFLEPSFDDRILEVVAVFGRYLNKIKTFFFQPNGTFYRKNSQFFFSY